jgi:NADH-quinone oxidoreductase subunit G
MSETNPKFTVTIDGQSVQVDPGTTILNAARMIGGDVVPPAMCYYSSLKGSGGKCRTCLVEVSKGSEKDPRPMPKLVASCSTPIMDGMEVKNKSSEKVNEARSSLITPWIAQCAIKQGSVTSKIWPTNMAKAIPGTNSNVVLLTK